MLECMKLIGIEGDPTVGAVVRAFDRHGNGWLNNQPIAILPFIAQMFLDIAAGNVDQEQSAYADVIRKISLWVYRETPSRITAFLAREVLRCRYSDHHSIQTIRDWYKDQGQALSVTQRMLIDEAMKDLGLK